MLKVAICDDDELCLIETQKLILQWRDNTSIDLEVTLFKDGDELINSHTEFPFDIIFLDIIMPLLNGIDTAKEIRNKDSNVCLIFLTSSPEFALESYDVQAFSYVIKPTNYFNINKLLDRYLVSFQYTPKSIHIKNGSITKKIYLKDINYVEAQNKIVTFNLIDNSFVQTKGPLYRFEDVLLPEDGFLKCHRSYIVSINNINSFSNNEIFLRSGSIIPLSKNFSKNFHDNYFAYMFK